MSLGAASQAPELTRTSRSPHMSSPFACARGIGRFTKCKITAPKVDWKKARARACASSAASRWRSALPRPVRQRDEYPVRCSCWIKVMSAVRGMTLTPAHSDPHSLQKNDLDQNSTLTLLL